MSVARFAFLEPDQRPITLRSPMWHGRSGRSQIGYWRGLFFVAGLGLFLSGWFFLRWWIQPEWLAELSPMWGELVALVEAAAIFTLVFLLTGLWWRRRYGPAPSKLTPLSVEQLIALSPAAFEQYVAGLFRLKGYQVLLRGKSGDHGVDLEVSNDEGQRAIVQCKRYKSTVGEKTIRDLYGTFIHEDVDRAFLVSTGDISVAARKWAGDKPITLIDGQTLVQIAAALNQRHLET